MNVKEKFILCTLCNESIQVVQCTGEIKRHMKIHNREKPFLCRLCGNLYAKGSLKVEVVTLKYHCETCGKMFATESELTMHQRIHIGECSYTCNICKLDFARKKALSLHLKIHEDENRFQCEFCKSSFTDSYSLKVHRRSHTEKKVYQCDICPKTFFSEQNLKKHMMYHRSTELDIMPSGLSQEHISIAIQEEDAPTYAFQIRCDNESLE